MPEIEIPFRQWLPDLPDLNNPGLVEATNAYLSPKGYQPFKSAGTQVGDALLLWNASSALHMFGVRRVGGADSTIGFLAVGGLSAVVLDADGASGGSFAYSSSPARINPDFARFGDDIYIAADSSTFSDGPHDLFKYSITSGSFSAVSGSIPAGKTIARVRNFVMMGGVSDDTSDYQPYSFRWSGFNQPESWDVSDLTQAGIAEVEYPALGAVTAIVGGDSPMIFQERGITRIEYVGAPKVWSQRQVSGTHGVVCPQAVVEHNGLYYFVSSQGVHVTNGSTVEDISVGQVKNQIQAQLKPESRTVYGSYHIDKKAIVWTFVNSSGSFTYAFGYSLDTGTFFQVDGGYQASARGEVAQNEVTTFGVTISSGVGRLTPLDGDNLEATLTTGHIANAGSRAFADEVEPQYIGSGATVALSAKERLRDNASFSAYVAEEATTGIADIKADGRAIAVSVKFPAASDWSDFSGVVVNASGAGKR